MEIIDETETEYICKFLPEYRKEFQDGYGIHTIPKHIVGEGSLYELLNDNERHYEQISLFD